jgi:hypothetical protein
MDGAERSAIGHAGGDLLGDLGKQSADEDMVDIPGTALDLSATRGNESLQFSCQSLI